MSTPASPEYLTRLPEVIPPTTVLVHNSVRPQLPLGRNGFRAWLEPRDGPRLVVCDCGWMPKLGLHYRKRLAPVA